MRKGKVEKHEEQEVTEMKEVHLAVEAETTQEERTTKEDVILEEETAADPPEDVQAHLEVGVVLHLHKGDNITEVVQIITV